MAWIAAGQDAAAIEEALYEWLTYPANATHRKAARIYLAWGNQSYKLNDTVFKSACKWLLCNQEDETAQAVFAVVCNDVRLDRETKQFLAAWQQGHTPE